MNTSDLRTKPIHIIRNWDDADTSYTALTQASKSPWLFRGQRNCNWPLDSSLGRLLSEYNIPQAARNDYEQAIKKEFERACHLHANAPVPRDNTLSYLTMMQHFGAPTRLMDWTYSFYVALFFAIEDMDVCHTPTKSIVYAINADELDKAVVPTLNAHGLNDPYGPDRYFKNANTFEGLFWSSAPKRFVYRLNSFDLNQRSQIQQGLFLCPGDISCTFEENLDAVFSGAGTSIAATFVVEERRELKAQLLRRLHRMNISRATLFPGLQGFSESLRTRPVLPENVYSMRDLLVKNPPYLD